MHRPYRVRVSGRCRLCKFDIAHGDITISHIVVKKNFYFFAYTDSRICLI